MLEPAVPLDEASRLATLLGLNILDTPSEERFDRLTRFAQHLLGVPIALVSLVDSNRQWFKSCQGLDASETPRSISFCGHAILNDQVFIIPDAMLDPRFADNPLVAGAPHIRFYAGQPLKALDGSRVGTLCVIDTKPRQLNQIELDGLRDLAVLVENELNFLEYQHVAEALQESTVRLNLALTASKSCIWDADLVTGRIALDVHWSELLGEETHETEISFEQLAQLVPAEEAQEIKKQMAATLKGEKKDYWTVHRVRHRLGHWIWIESRGRVITSDASGRALRMIGTNTDITERKKSEESLTRIGNLHRAIVEGASHLIITTDTQGMILAFNRAAERSLGYRAEELVGKLTPAVFHVPEEVVRRAQELAVAGHPVEPGFEVFVAGSRKHSLGDAHEWTYVRKDGTHFPVLLTVTALRDINGEIYAFLGIATDISERNRAAQAQRENEVRLTAILDNILDGIITIGERGAIESYNKSAEDIFGYAAAEVIGNNVKMLMPEPYHSEHDGYLHNFNSTGKKKIIGTGREVVGRRKDGSTFPMDLAITEIQLGGKRIYTGIVRDITERVKIERMKSEFISTVSHELRTPLTSIRGSLGLIAGGVAGVLPTQAKALVDIAHKNSERLILLVNDILDMEKIEAGKMEFRSEPTALMSLLKQSLESNRAYAEQYKVTYVLEGELAEVIVNVDTNRMLQVLANLLSNAAKFSPAGGEVIVTATSDGKHARVGVSDHGGGIPEQFRSQIFQKFSQADSSDTRMKGGTGLGLSITKAIVEHMGGSIGFDSQPDVLTTFFVEFPVWREPMADAPEATATDKTDKRRRVLICEDDYDIATLLRLMLEQDGLAADVAYDAAQAKQLLALHDYAAMTLDLGLPDQNGLSLIRELRTDKRTARLPIIVVSANADKGRKELSGDTFSMIDWINKPINHEQLVSALRQAIAQAAVARPRVLHVEDDIDIYQIVDAIVGDLANIENAPSLAVARRLLKDRYYDLAILDVTLPDGSGMELLRELNSATPPVPVIMFSAHETTMKAVQQVGASLVKSRTDNVQLLANIKKQLGII